VIWPWQQFDWGVFWALLAALLVYFVVRFVNWILVVLFTAPDAAAPERFRNDLRRIK